MPQTELDLKRVRSEMIDYIHQSGLPVFYSTCTPDPESALFWDGASYPDWRQFVDVAKESGARLLVFASEELTQAALEDAFEKLDDCELDSDERRTYTRQFEALRKRVGQTAWIRMAFEHGGQWLNYALSAPWHEEFESVVEDLELLLPYEDLDEEEEEEEGGSGRGFFSRN
jgi:hypothetical protein